MNEIETKLYNDAKTFAKKNWVVFRKKIADEKKYPVVDYPTSIFMAGSPGAGKTEVSKRLLQEFETPVVRIDADDIRVMFEGYTGNNSYIFQSAGTIAVNNLYNHCLKRKKNLLLDATFAYKDSLENIAASLRKGRRVGIFFIFQEPRLAWQFTKDRERVDHRRVTREVFINSFFDSIVNVNEAKKRIW